MRRRGPVLALALAAIAAFLPRCTNDGPAGPPPAVAGTRTIVIASPNGGEGGALIEIDAASVRSVSVDTGAVFSQRNGARLRVVVMRATAGVLRLNVQVDDTTAALAPALVEVAGPDNALRALQGYTITVSR